MEFTEQNNNEFPPEAREEIRKSSGWIMFMGIIAILGVLFGFIGTLNLFALGMGAAGVVNIIALIIAGYNGVLLLQASSSFKRFAQTGEPLALQTAMKSTARYFMIAVIMIVLNLIINLLFKQ